MKETSLALRVFGVDVDLCIPAAEEASLRDQWAWCLPDDPAQRVIAPLPTAASPVESHRPIEITRPMSDGEDAGHADDYRLTTALTGSAITRCSGQYVMLHAGGVSDSETGRVAALVAASGTGKTTATHHFGSHGYGYVTDESLIFNDRREVLPYPKPLSVVLAPDAPYHKSQHGPEELGLRHPGSGPLTLGPFILLDRGPLEGDEPHLEAVGLFDGLAKILPQSSSMPDVPGCLDLLARLAVETGGIHSLRYEEISHTEPLLRRAFAAPATQPFWRHVPGTWDAGTDGSPYLVDVHGATHDVVLDDDALLVRGPFTDAILDDATFEGLVLVGATPALLQGIGTLLWLATEQPTSLASLVDGCTETFGAHPEAPRIVRDSATVMLRSRLLRRG